MSSADPRERDDLCGRELVPPRFGGKFPDEYDRDTWYEAEDEAHFCCREVWDRADTDRCIWHADISGKPADELVASLSGPARLDWAVLRDVVFPHEIDLAGCRFQGADLTSADLRHANLKNVDLDGADLTGAGLQHADLSDAFVQKADLTEARLQNADITESSLQNTDLIDATLQNADLSDALLWHADFTGADLKGADFIDADLKGADLYGADLWVTDLTGADLRGADLTECRLRQTTFEDATFDEATTFGARSGYEKLADEEAADKSWLPTRLSSWFRATGRPSTHALPLELAETQYRTIQRLRREHDLKQDPELEIQEKHARRKRALAEGRYWDWFKLAFYRWPMGYGERPGQVVGTSLAVIGLSALLYPLVGGIARPPRPEETAVVAWDLLPSVPVALPEWAAEGLTSLYFSVVTFTTLGYGDLQPASGAAQAVATLESFVGALLMALLVFVLGRRATW